MENNKNLLIIVLSILAVIVVLGGLGLYTISVKQSNDLRQEVSSAINQLSDQITELKGQPVVSDVTGSADLENPANITTPAADTTQSVSRVSIDQTWDLYTNKNLGFSIKIPKKVLTANKTQEALEIIEDGNVVYVTFRSNYYYKEMTSRIANQISLGLNDVKKTTGIPWGIMVRDINNEQELSRLIKERYGSGCSLGAKTISEEPDTYNVAINGDGLDLDKTKCSFGFIRYVKYSPTFKKAAIWDGGQAINFRSSPNNEFDTIMAGSFKFIK